jgi:hypothetical protein
LLSFLGQQNTKEYLVFLTLRCNYSQICVRFVATRRGIV